MTRDNILAYPISLSVVVPVFNEEDVILEFYRRLTAVLQSMDMKQAEILFVNDGSTDRTLSLLMQLARSDQRVQVIDLSRNFGKEAAMTAGLDHVRGDATIIIDADLQDSPELIPQMLREWRKGYDVVSMRRIRRDGETWLKLITARWFYRLMKSIGQIRIPQDVGDFRLLSRRAVEALRRMPERCRFMKGVFAWIGFPTVEIPYHREARPAGSSKWQYLGLWNLAVEGITSFSVVPLKFAGVAGLLLTAGGAGMGLYLLAKTVWLGGSISTSLLYVALCLFLSGLQLLAIGIVGEYLGKIMVESKQRPLYLLNRHYRAPLSHPILSLTRKEAMP